MCRKWFAISRRGEFVGIERGKTLGKMTNYRRIVNERMARFDFADESKKEREKRSFGLRKYRDISIDLV